MEICVYTQHHHDEVASLWREAFPSDAAWNDPDTAIAAKVGFQPALFFVAVDGGTLIGTTMAAMTATAVGFTPSPSSPTAAAKVSPPRLCVTPNRRLPSSDASNSICKCGGAMTAHGRSTKVSAMWPSRASAWASRSGNSPGRRAVDLSRPAHPKLTQMRTAPRAPMWHGRRNAFRVCSVFSSAS